MFKSRFILWLTWGRRERYPPYVVAAPRLWLTWFLEFPWLTKPFMYAEKPRTHGSRQKRRLRERALIEAEKKEHDDGGAV